MSAFKPTSYLPLVLSGEPGSHIAFAVTFCRRIAFPRDFKVGQNI